MSLQNLCDDVLIEISIWCDLRTLIQLIRTQRQFSDLFRRDCVWKHKVHIDFQDTVNQETSHYLSYQFLFKRANFLNLINQLNLVRFYQVFTLSELDEEINRYWFEAVKDNGYVLQIIKDQ